MFTRIYKNIKIRESTREKRDFRDFWSKDETHANEVSSVKRRTTNKEKKTVSYVQIQVEQKKQWRKEQIDEEKEKHCSTFKGVFYLYNASINKLESSPKPEETSENKRIRLKSNNIIEGISFFNGLSCGVKAIE